MATVQLIDGRIIEGVRLTDVHHVGDEGARSATAHIAGATYVVHNSIVDGFNPIWYEQMSLETFRMLKGADKFVEGSIGDLSDKDGEG